MIKVGYFIAGSLHYLPTILPLIKETGGMIITFRNIPDKYLNGEESVTVVRFSGYRSLLKNIESLNINILVHPSFSVQYFKGVEGIKHVQVFHGTSDKPFNFHKSLKYYDLIVVPGKKMREDIIARGLAEDGKIKIVGYPKLDSFLNSDFDKDAFLKDLGIKNNKKIVLYSPTWDDPDNYSSFKRFISVVVRGLKEFNVIVKPHPNILKYRPWQILKAFLIKRKNVRIYPGKMNIIPLMSVSDIMLTDISTVSHEYLAFDKPMIFLAPKDIDRIPEEHRWIWRCGDVVKEPSKLPEIVKNNLYNKDMYSDVRNEAKKYIFYNFDGKSAIRFKSLLSELIKS